MTHHIHANSETSYHIHASKAYRVSNCPGSIKLERSFQKCSCVERKQGSKYAEEGTRRHELIHDALDGNIDISSLPREDHDLIQRARDFAFRKFGGVGVCEQKYQIAEEGSDLVMAVATADMSRYDSEKDTVYIVDWKFYNGPLNQAEVQWQMIVNLTGAMLHFKAKHGIAWVYNPIQNQEFEYELRDVRTGVGVITNIWRKANEKDPRLNPGSWCKWCDCVDVCPAVKNTIHGVLDQTGIRDLKKDSGKKPSQDLIKSTLYSEITKWSPQRLREATEMLAFLKPLDEAIREHIKRDLHEDPNKHPDWILTSRKQSVSKDSAAVKEFRDKIGYTTKQIEVLRRR